MIINFSYLVKVDTIQDSPATNVDCLYFFDLLSCGYIKVKGVMHMCPVLFNVGSWSVYSWGFMLAIAVIVSIYGIGKLFEKEGLDKENVIDMVLLMVVAVRYR